MRLCMVAASLAGGGAERALLDTAVLLAARGHHVTVLTFNGESSDAYPVPACLSRVALGVPSQSGNRLRGIPNNLRRIARLRAEVRRLRPDVVVSYLSAAVGMAQVVVVSKGLATQYAWLGADKLSVINNFLPKSRGSEPETFRFLSDDVCYIVGMGRLEPEKGFDRLIKAFHLVEKDCPGWKLLIVGEGSRRTELARLVASLGLEGRVELPGRVSNPRTLFRQCNLFCLSSESEGFGLVLIEAMSSGLPVISFDCDFGPREIITSNVSGVLVPPGDVPALSRAIGRLVRDGALRARLARGGLKSVSRFAPDEILNRWEDLLRRVTNPGIARREAHPSARGAERS